MSNELIAQYKSDFEQIATRENLVLWSEESQFAGQAMSKNPTLAASAPLSIRDSIVNVAAIGLTLNPAYGYAYLVPESVKIGSDYVKICQLRISFKGLMKIATDSGSIKWVKAEIVKANDVFTYRGPCELPTHEMNPFSDRGATVGVYCVAKTGDADYLTDVMGIEEINKCMNAAKTKGVWQNWFDEMAKKAIIKRASKQWPLGNGADRFNQAVSVVNDLEGSEEINKERDITPPPPMQKQTISDERLANAFEKIVAGEYTVDRLQNTFELTESQMAKVIDFAEGRQ